MACDISSPAASPYQDSIFDDDWKPQDNDLDNGLDSIAEFNASFNNSNAEFNAGQSIGGGIDPQLLSSAPSPSGSDTRFDDANAATHIDTSMFDVYPPSTAESMMGQTGPPPYFHQSFECPDFQNPLYAPSPLRGQLHRRSVSEPPDQHHFPSHMLPGPQPPMPTFTRQGIALGTPRQQHGLPVQRYATKVNKQPLYRQPFSVVKRQVPRQERYHLRRANTQPVRVHGGPTSVPSPQLYRQLPQRQPNMAMMLPPAQPEMFSPAPMVTSRVCTPVPSPERRATPAQIDPRLESPMLGTAREQPSFATKMSVEELKAMIKEAVFEGMKAAAGRANATMIELDAQQAADGPLPIHAEGTDDLFDFGADDFHEVGEEDQVRQSIEDDGMQQ